MMIKNLTLMGCVVCCLWAVKPLHAAEPTSVYGLEEPERGSVFYPTILVRIVPNLGLVSKTDSNFFGDFDGINKFIYLWPEGNISFQLTGHWFASASFVYARTKWKNQLPASLTGFFGIHGTTLDTYGTTFGIKYIGWLGEQAYDAGGSFLDRSNFWAGLELGSYVTNYLSGSRSGFSGSVSNTSFGFNGSFGFDYFFHPRVGTGIQAKMHYVKDPNDDFILWGFGPVFIVRF